jgi:hypothetical protein
MIVFVSTTVQYAMLLQYYLLVELLTVPVPGTVSTVPIVATVVTSGNDSRYSFALPYGTVCYATTGTWYSTTY